AYSSGCSRHRPSETARRMRARRQARTSTRPTFPSGPTRRPMLNPDGFYSPGAYCPEHIPDQPPATKQPWLRRFGSMRLPWGNTQDMLPPCVLTNIKPADLRHQEEIDRVRNEQMSRGEYIPRPFEHI